MIGRRHALKLALAGTAAALRLIADALQVPLDLLVQDKD